MKKTAISFNFLLFSLLLHGIPFLNNDNSIKKIVYHQSLSFISDRTKNTSIYVNYLELHPQIGQYVIKRSNYVFWAPLDDFYMSSIDTISTGTIIEKNDTLLCIDSIKGTIRFKKFDDRLLVLNEIHYYKENEILYLNRIEGKHSMHLFWKNNEKESCVIHEEEGSRTIFYENGLPKDTTFTRYEDMKTIID
ncbi:hypothetical protein EZS27_017607 [termite gut metagenome]|uniref:Uncharacterized protein n=1 Tax=termite gut metagenome TaxID=433724 RepID=A0A5J4RKH2_9ZZZZ